MRTLIFFLLCLHTAFASSLFQIGGSYTHVNLKVHDNASFHGSLGGLQASYEYRDRLYAAAKFSWKQGNTKTTSASRFLDVIDLQERLGLALLHHHWRFAFFSGVGYRHLGHNLHRPSINFYYNEIYIPVGLLSDYTFNSWCNLALNLTWMPQVYPTVRIVPLKGARWMIKDTLDNISVELPLTFTFTQKRFKKRCALVVKPFYEHWQDGHSTAKTSNGSALNLPSNTYNFWGLELNFAYSF